MPTHFGRLLTISICILLAVNTFGQGVRRGTPEKNPLLTYPGGTFYPVEPLIKRIEQDTTHAPRNVILLIGDGMGVAHLTAGMVANGGELYITQFLHTGFLSTHNATSFVTNSCAAATAMATGTKTITNHIGLDPAGNPLTNIREVLARHGLATGLVATSSITHATPAGFYARQNHREKHEEIAMDLTHSGVDLFMGGGLQYFIARGDGNNLIRSLETAGYVIDTQSVAPNPVLHADTIRSVVKFAGLYASNHIAKRSEGRDDFLPTATRQSIELLNRYPNGFFLMVEGSQIDFGGHDNDTRYIVEEMLDFDQAVGEALRFAVADGNTLVIVTSDHECGGMAIHNGEYRTGKVAARYTTTDHTGTLVPLFAYGPGAELFSGFLDNTDLPKIIARLFGLSLPGM